MRVSTDNVINPHTSGHVHRIRSGRYAYSNLGSSVSEAQTKFSGVNSQNMSAIYRRCPCSPNQSVSVQTPVRESKQSTAKTGKTCPEHRRPCTPYSAPTHSKYSNSQRPDNLFILLLAGDIFRSYRPHTFCTSYIDAPVSKSHHNSTRLSREEFRHRHRPRFHSRHSYRNISTE